MNGKAIFAGVGTCLTLLLALSLAVGIAFGHGNEFHGNHDPKHGGKVLMYQDIHFEVVALEEGAVRLYLSGPMRADLPAVTVSDVTVEIEREDGFESVAMGVSDGGDFWEGSGRPLTGPGAVLHLAFLYQGEPRVYRLEVEWLQTPEPPMATQEAA